MCDELDLEEIECRLYSQVYHSSAENEETTSDLCITSCSDDKLHNNRYFAKEQISSIPTFIPLLEERTNSNQFCPSVQNNILLNSNSTDIIITDGNSNNQFQNNITVNQFTVPFIIDSGVNEVLDQNPENRAYFVPWCVENKTLLNRKGRKRQLWLKRRREKNKERRNKKRVRKVACEVDIINSAQAKIDNIICISDESDNDCKIVNNMQTTVQENMSRKSMNSNATNEYDDDIIYVPPPPIEIVNVDVDSEEEKSTENVCETLKKGESAVNKVLCTSNPPSTNQSSNNPESNDFLENSGTEVQVSLHNFNFSLHGSDFTNSGDFVRPANPVEYCETESSCSTNDLNKENNCVKTIVFKEVDFPKEDIFSDKNLEGFGTYITPKRYASKEAKANHPPKLVSNCNRISTEDTSSSSESDYEPPDIPNNGVVVSELECNKKLPILSPMQCGNTAVNKRVATLKLGNSDLQVISSSKKLSCKRKSNAKDSNESNNTEGEDESKSSKKKTTKKKKRTNKARMTVEDVNMSEATSSGSNNHIIDSDGTKPISKKKVKNSLVDKIEVTRTQNGGQLNRDEIDGEKSLPKKKKKNVSTKEQVINLTSTEILARKLKRKKRKNGSEKRANNNMPIISVDELNNSWVGIADICEKQVVPSNNNNCDSNDNESTGSSLRNEELVLSNDIENDCHFKNIPAEPNNSENLNQNVINIPVFNTSQDREESFIDDQFIVVDETFCDKSDHDDEDQIEVVSSSESECDFKQLGDVGYDLKLANCSSSNVVTENETPGVSQSKNIIRERSFEDYSKFDLEEIQRRQSDDPNDWKILTTDRLLFLNFDRNKGPRCNRCRQFGHIAMRCIEKPFPPNCSLCGACGHQEPRCPNKRCTQCGNEGDYSTTYCWKCFKFRNSICRICNMKGHIARTCPDLWRRYHLTTQEGPLIIPQGPQLKPKDQLWCSGCAGQGHLEHECNYYNREYPPANPCIISYEDILQGENRCTFPEETVTVHSSPPSPGYLLPTPFINLPSSSQDFPYDSTQYNPSLVSLISNLKSLFPTTETIDENQAVPSNDINCHSSTRVLNPFSVIVQREKTVVDHTALNQMMLDYMNNDTNVNYIGHRNQRGEVLIRPQLVHQGARELLKKDQRKVKQIIMAMPCNEVKEFLGAQLAELENVISQTDPKYLRKKLFKFDRIYNCRRTLNCEIVKEKCFWDRVLNMFIFGVHQLRDGKIHFDFLKKCLLESRENRLDTQKRKSLFNAYKYIFDGTRHGNINYYKVMQQLIQKNQQES